MRRVLLTFLFILSFLFFCLFSSSASDRLLNARNEDQIFLIQKPLPFSGRRSSTFTLSQFDGGLREASWSSQIKGDPSDLVVHNNRLYIFFPDNIVSYAFSEKGLSDWKPIRWDSSNTMVGGGVAGGQLWGVAIRGEMLLVFSLDGDMSDPISFFDPPVFL